MPASLHAKYDAVIDSGTPEHVFNFPVALASAMSMVRKGGYLFVVTMANNHCGHGFYQFSSELFFRALARENGFRIRCLLLAGIRIPACSGRMSGELWR